MSITIPHTFHDGDLIVASQFNDNFAACGAYTDTKSPWVTPEMFGAVGDGVTSDTIALQAAIAATPVGGTLWLSQNYAISSLTIPKSMIVCGGGTLTQIAGTSASSMLALTSGNVTIKDITLNGQIGDAIFDLSNVNCGIYGAAVDNIIIDTVNIYEKGCGIFIKDSNNGVIKNCNITWGEEAIVISALGLALTGVNASNWLIANNRCIVSDTIPSSPTHRAHMRGIVTHHVSDLIVDGNYVVGGQLDIESWRSTSPEQNPYLIHTKNVKVINNTCARWITLSTGSGGVASNNIVDYSLAPSHTLFNYVGGPEGIELIDSHDTVCSDNVIRNIPATALFIGYGSTGTGYALYNKITATVGATTATVDTVDKLYVSQRFYTPNDDGTYSLYTIKNIVGTTLTLERQSYTADKTVNKAVTAKTIIDNVYIFKSSNLSVNNNLIANCGTTGGSADAISIGSAVNSSFANNIITGQKCGTAIAVTGYDGAVRVGSVVTRPGNDFEAWSSDIELTGNCIYNCNSQGIAVYNAKNVNIVGGVLSNLTPGAASHGIKIGAGGARAHNVLVQSVKISNCSNAGIYVEGAVCKDVHLLDNFVRGNAGSSNISPSGGTNGIIRGNIGYSLGHPGTPVSGTFSKGEWYNTDSGATYMGQRCTVAGTAGSPMGMKITITAGSDAATVTFASGLKIGMVIYVQNDDSSYSTHTIATISSNNITLEAAAAKAATSKYLYYHTITTVTGAPVATLNSTIYLSAGMYITVGTDSYKIKSVDSGTQITLTSNAASDHADSYFTFTQPTWAAF